MSFWSFVEVFVVGWFFEFFWDGGWFGGRVLRDSFFWPGWSLWGCVLFPQVSLFGKKKEQFVSSSCLGKKKVTWSFWGKKYLVLEEKDFLARLPESFRPTQRSARREHKSIFVPCKLPLTP